jgi:ComF family protein
LGKRRLQERGYNQVGLIAMPLAALNRWRYAPRALCRVRETKSQVGLSAVERRENMQGAFRADSRPVGGRVILLLDDVATTSATLSACAEALLSAGAKAVFALTLARALPRHGLQNV